MRLARFERAGVRAPAAARGLSRCRRPAARGRARGACAHRTLPLHTPARTKREVPWMPLRKIATPLCVLCMTHRPTVQMKSCFRPVHDPRRFAGQRPQQPLFLPATTLFDMYARFAAHTAVLYSLHMRSRPKDKKARGFMQVSRHHPPGAAAGARSVPAATRVTGNGRRRCQIPHTRWITAVTPPAPATSYKGSRFHRRTDSQFGGMCACVAPAGLPLSPNLCVMT